MNQLMENLFILLDPPQPSQEEQLAAAAAKETIQAAKQRLTNEEFERLWNVLMDVGCADCLNSFTRGFRLGVQLTLEGLRPID